MNKESLKQHLKENNISFEEKQIELLFSFMSYTLQTNEKFNLTSITDEETFVEKMIFDSAIALKDLDLKNKKIIDVGTGAGYPGMVLKILSNDSDFYLLDSTKKKIDYLNDFAKKNNLKVNCVSSRSEDYARNHREEFDFAIARAVAQLNILLEIITPMLKVNGTFIAMKGLGYEKEINDSKKALEKLNLKIDHLYEFDLPESKEKRVLIYIKKLKETNHKYPRDYAEIKRKQL